MNTDVLVAVVYSKHILFNKDAAGHSMVAADL